MRPSLSFLWTWNRTIDRLPYLLTGVVLMLIKYGLDWTVATQAFGRSWSPLHYVVWPDYASVRLPQLPPEDRAFSLTMLVISLPFIWTGVILTVHRLRAAKLPVGLVVLFFVPLVNLLLFLVLVLAPTAPGLSEVAVPARDVPEPHTGRVGQPVGESQLASESPPAMPRERMRPDEDGGALGRAALALGISVPLTVGLVFLGTVMLESYGFGLFVGAPFALGLISVVIFGASRPQGFGQCMGVAFAATTLAGLAILAVAIEGFICLIMAAPIAYFLTFLGALVGYSIQARPWLSRQAPALCLGLLTLLPGLMAAESADEPEPPVLEVRTDVEIAAPPDQVWGHVLAFPPLPEPDGWLFRTGVAYPKSANIVGSGPGAVRYCVFSTGAFVEPIDLWDAPRLLRFRVTEQPAPMREWSPYNIHPPHLDHYLVSRQGQFRLEALPGGRTRLEGTTWYTNRMWPAPYWALWSDFLIHRIHAQVLEHIRALAEADSAISARTPASR